MRREATELNFDVIWALFIDFGGNSIQLLTVHVLSCSEGCVAWQHLVINDTFAVPPNVSHNLQPVEACRPLRLRLLILVNPVSIMFDDEEQAPLLVSCDDERQPVILVPVRKQLDNNLSTSLAIGLIMGTHYSNLYTLPSGCS